MLVEGREALGDDPAELSAFMETLEELRDSRTDRQRAGAPPGLAGHLVRLLHCRLGKREETPRRLSRRAGWREGQ
ncbi:MAG: hypothetical protein Udaeo2_12600 [Candidatus Udaeobacter sp.]|nr:MAG: hypothetical protein Udaeo2_12600 [Candidatus Udaeobacter sp.]